MTKSHTMQALEMIDAGKTVAEAARLCEISTAAIYAAERRRKGKVLCPMCEQIVRAGFEVKSAQPITIDAYPTDHPATRLESNEPSFRDMALAWLDARAEQQPDPVGKKWIAAIAKGMRTLGG